MAAISKTHQPTIGQLQHEGSSFYTIEEMFPPLHQKGVELLGKAASKVHVLVYQMEVFAGLTLEENKVKYAGYKEEFEKIKAEVLEFKGSLGAIEQEINVSIEVLSEVASLNKKVLASSYLPPSVKETCDTFLPKLKDFKFQSVKLKKELDQTITYYEEAASKEDGIFSLAMKSLNELDLFLKS